MIYRSAGLRQDYASTSATASRRSSSFSLHSLRRSEMDLEEEDEEDEGYDQLPPPQPRLFRTGSMQRGGLPHSHTFSSMRDCKRSATTSQFSLSGLSQYSGPASVTTEAYTSFRNSIGELLSFIWIGQIRNVPLIIIIVMVILIFKTFTKIWVASDSIL